MPKGYMGKVAFVDLAAGSVREEPLEDEICRRFIGGFGLGVRILYERMPANVDPLGPDNLLGFVTGPLTGTPVPSSGRYTVVGKAPLTGTWGDSNSGGYFGPELKAAGYDAVFFSGISPKPVYLLLYDGKAELRDAAHLWGKDTVDTEEILRQELGDPAIRVACIGPSGESQSLIAAIITEKGRAAGRGGLAAVMGAKRLKAIAARGTSKVAVADSSRISALRKEYVKALSGEKAGSAPLFRTYGLAGLVGAMVKGGGAPIKNWNLIGAEAFPNYTKLDGPEVIKYEVKKFACKGCPIACGGIVRLDKGPYAIKGEGHKPEYETLITFGTLCLSDDVEAVIKANDICNRSGLDTISAGAAIAFAIECYEAGIVGKQETDGIELTWGNTPAVIAMLEKLARREGFGAVLADGVKKAAEQIGRGSEKFAIHVHGQELPAHDPRLPTPYGVAYISDPTPGRHTSGLAMVGNERMPVGPYPELKADIKGVHDYQAKASSYFIASNYGQVLSCSGGCLFSVLTGGNFPLVEFIAAVTGWDFTFSELLTTGQRIQTLRQLFNIREGLKPADFSLPDRVKEPPFGGPFARQIIDLDALRMLYYRAMDWDIETGRPSEAALQELGLAELAGVLP